MPGFRKIKTNLPDEQRIKIDEQTQDMLKDIHDVGAESGRRIRGFIREIGSIEPAGPAKESPAGNEKKG
jgi:hypothetical protein